MLWVHLLRDFLLRALKRKTDFESRESAAFHLKLEKEAVDWLYFWLGSFTNIYLFTLAALFLTQSSHGWLILSGVLGALEEPYLGAVGIYVLLKELRKKRGSPEGRHLGELFVLLWMMLLFLAVILVVFTDYYKFDETFKLIITNGLATVLIYVAGVLHRP